ncbi:MAG: peptidyl-prolyl cis-trans isomerase [Balneolaceae bacterium]|nr:peptidyl-prolyl cis-trans isomerase [Balneolaceae bacterium]
MIEQLIKFFLLITVTAFAFGGCNSNGRDSDAKELARVGNEYLTLDEAINEIPEFVLSQDSIKALSDYREKWIERQIVLQEAQRLQLAQSEEVRKRIQKAEEEILKQALKEAILQKFNNNLKISDQEAQNYYQAHKDQFILNERFVKFRHIETNDLESARAARRDLARGISWPEVARDYSINPEAAIRSSEQYWPISIALSDLDIMNDYLRRIGHTERSVIRRIGENYHFVQLMDSRAAGEHPDLDWLIEQIKEWLVLDKRNRHFSSYVKNLYLKAQSNNEITIYNVLKKNTSNISNEKTDTLESN